MTPNEDIQCRTPTSSRGSLITVVGSNPAPATKSYETPAVRLAFSFVAAALLFDDRFRIAADARCDPALRQAGHERRGTPQYRRQVVLRRSHETADITSFRVLPDEGRAGACPASADDAPQRARLEGAAHAAAVARPAPGRLAGRFGVQVNDAIHTASMPDSISRNRPN